jgi:hypothetical protein
MVGWLEDRQSGERDDGFASSGLEGASLRVFEL